MNNKELFGFDFDASGISEPPRRAPKQALAIFKSQLPGFIYNAAKLEGNPFSFVEVKTLLDGITVGGHRVSDAEQVTNLSDSTRKLIELVAAGAFALDKATFVMLNGMVSRNESLEWGLFRGEGSELNYQTRVNLGELGDFHPAPTAAGAPELNQRFYVGAEAINAMEPWLGALVFFLFGAYQQFFFDGNKRTSRLMASGWLMQHGYAAINIPATRAQEFNQVMVDFYHTADGTDALHFLRSCEES